jgi:hypothetical protein
MPQADWLISGLKKFVLPAQESHLSRSQIHFAGCCTNKIFKETKSYYAVP